MSGPGRAEPTPGAWGGFSLAQLSEDVSAILGNRRFVARALHELREIMSPVKKRGVRMAVKKLDFYLAWAKDGYAVDVARVEELRV